MTQKHTPTPWKVYQFGGVQIGQEDTGEAICSMWGDKSEGDANAAHIVKCVNMHDELVEVLELARQDLADWIEATEDDDNYQLGDTRMIINRISETLKKAGAL